jgi:hypothetical protein
MQMKEQVQILLGDHDRVHELHHHVQELRQVQVHYQLLHLHNVLELFACEQELFPIHHYSLN